MGRTPEFLGKQIGRHVITMAALSILVMPVLVLVGTAITVILPSTKDFQGNGGDPGTPGSIHGFSGCCTPSHPLPTTAVLHLDRHQ